ncbi:polyisoprenoid-binding protein YceI [Anseongella ginsenosidimutans]|uniref:Polyisoprenoid-binding protein YceI n=1 Tax=Anseongella ginsenosidimutans TaxID=496056 RepID=A0A4R3KQJ9_9SPHI|nr:YceI family protein [Anseongella ginsenosidimutans]QEC53889.1 YceI family protein [Anseongella ginsenosidimutans]TCS86271.1 polyisoprenoid-binding protein YceI [Anseongella ginsenosidimutans]
MKKILSFLAIALLSTSVLFAQSTWQADPAHSKVAFSITHSGISDVSGLFNSFESTITAAKEDFSDAVFDLSIEVASIDTEIEKRDNHLRSADFFDVEKFPKITFKSTGIKKAGKDRYKLTGDLTMHGVTKPVTMDLWYRGTNVSDRDNSSTAGFQLTGTLKRSDFGIGSKFSPPMLSDEVQIKADGEFKKQ